MILILSQQATHPEAEKLIERLTAMGLKAVKEQQGDRIAIAIVSGLGADIQTDSFLQLPLVERIEQFSQQFKLAGKDFRQGRLVIDVRGKTIGGDELCVVAGPCSIETEEQIHRIAKLVAAAGAKFLRGGAFKPRTSPYDFQGLGADGVQFMHDAAHANDMVSVSEVMDTEQLEIAAPKIDILQVGARNMQNYSLLKALGRVQNPIMLKRGFAATYKELLMAAEYILNAGNPNVILCERGIRSYESYTRNMLDIGAVPVLKELSHLPVIIDPSHGTGIRNMIAPMSRAAVAAGADGVMIEVHYDPDNSYSDAQQAISDHHFADIMQSLNKIHQVLA